MHNLSAVRALVGKARIMAVVKANAYGAGAIPVARQLASAGVDLFGVASVREGVELVQNGIQASIVCLTYFGRDETNAILEFGLIPVIFTLDAAHGLSERARALNRRARVWVKVDTGLGRIGIPHPLASDFIKRITLDPDLELEGVFSTLAENRERDRIQVQRLNAIRHEVPKSHLLWSIASSNGILSRRDSYMDVVRPGIMLLGLEPSDRERMDIELVRQTALRSVVTWKTRVGYVKAVGAGEQIGYGSRTGLTEDRQIATLTIGWSDGYPPSMSQGGHVLLHGQRFPVLAVTANCTMVDTTHLTTVAIGDQVVLLGTQGSEKIPAVELARLTGESIYRLLSAVPRETRRLWV